MNNNPDDPCSSGSATGRTRDVVRAEPAGSGADLVGSTLFCAVVRARMESGRKDAMAGARVAAPRLATSYARPPRAGRESLPTDAAALIARLEEAGETLMSLPPGGYSTRLRTGALDMVREAAELAAGQTMRLRPPAPPPARIDRMDEALAWIPLIPAERYVLRRIVGARALVHPMTGRHIFAWRRLGTAMGADHKAVQRWHKQGIAVLLGVLNG